MYGWIKGFLCDRKIRTSINSFYSRSRSLQDGLPQGSALSCTWFLFYINDLSEFVRTPTRLAFVDDFVLWQQSQDVSTAEAAINRDLALLKRYCERWKMRLNATKTVYTVYSNSNEALRKKLEIVIGETSLRRDDLPRYLGVLLDPRLRLTKHIEQTAVKATERVALMRKLAGVKWGATLHSLRTIYVTFVRPILEYASPVMSLASETTLSKLDRVQNTTMRLMAGGLRSTPITALEIATRCEPPSLRRRGQTLLARERFLRFPEHSPLRTMTKNFGNSRHRLKKTSVLSAAPEAERTFDLPVERSPLLTPKWSPDASPIPLAVKLDVGLSGRKVDFAPSVLKATALECIDQYPNGFAKCYIDGSATEGTKDGGFGVTIKWPGVATETELKGPVGNRTCSFDCERPAFEACVASLTERQERVSLLGAVIFCDCLALLQALSGRSSTGVSSVTA